MKARVRIALRAGVLDPQGKAVEHALHGLGFDGVGGVRVGKLIDLDLPDGLSAEDARARVTEMCDRLLANPVMEDYEVEILG